MNISDDNNLYYCLRMNNCSVIKYAMKKFLFMVIYPGDKLGKKNENIYICNGFRLKNNNYL